MRENGQIEQDTGDLDSIRLKYLAQVNPSKSELSGIDPDTEVSFVPLEGFSTEESITSSEVKPLEEVYDGYTYFREGDIALAKITPSFENGKGAICRNLKNGIGFGTTELHIIRPSSEVHDRFLWYVLRSKRFMKEAESAMKGVAGQKRVPSSFVEDFRVWDIPVEKQQSIVKFLDFKTSQIDTLIKKKQKSINLIEERDESTITKAVTQGIESDVGLVVSNSKDLGKIPKHWDVKKLRWLLSRTPKNGVSPPIVSESEGTPTFSISAVERGEISVKDNLKYADISPEDSQRYEIEEGDVLLVRGNGNIKMVGKCGIVTPPIPDGCIYPDILMKLDFRPDSLPEYFVYLLNSSAIRPQMEIGARTSTGVWKVSQKTVSNIRVPCPPLNEQKEIVEYLSAATGETKHITEKTRKSIDLLLEKRQALITNAVTGKVDVTDWEFPEKKEITA